MKVAHLAPHSIVFPLASHNGRYQWLLDLARRQAADGLDVDIYSNPASQMDIPGVTWRSVKGEFGDSTQANKALLTSALQDGSVDIYHSAFDNLHYSFASQTTRPIVATQHWWPSTETVAAVAVSQAGNVWAVPPTRFMRNFDAENGIQSRGFIHHGIDLELFKPAEEPRSDRLLLVSRISPEKNIMAAIDTAQQSGLGLDIIGKLLPKHAAYWETLAPHIDGAQIRYHGAKTAQELVVYYAQARAVIFPADIHEAFGLVAIEAQACGAPVLMNRGGSRAELVKEGVSGYLCSSVAEFAAAAVKANQLTSADCRQFARYFDVQTMVKHYTELYLQLVG